MEVPPELMRNPIDTNGKPPGTRLASLSAAKSGFFATCCYEPLENRSSYSWTTDQRIESVQVLSIRGSATPPRASDDNPPHDRVYPPLFASIDIYPWFPSAD